MAVTILVCGVTLAVPAGASGSGDVQHRMVSAVNQVRAQHGLTALAGSSTLHRSARRYARWMLRAEYFGHLERIRASSRYSMLGENLAWHSGRRPRVASTVRRWMASPPHRALILHPGFRWLGAGPAHGTLGGRRVTAWVLHFGGALTARGAAAPVTSLVGDQLPSDASIPVASPEIVSTSSPAGSSAAIPAP
jgi:uncharacterized protein YkwD